MCGEKSLLQEIEEVNIAMGLIQSSPSASFI